MHFGQVYNIRNNYYVNYRVSVDVIGREFGVKWDFR